MATGKTGLGIKNKGLLIVGIVILVVGLGLSFYQIEDKYREASNLPLRVVRSFPFQPVGLVLVVAGIIFIALGFIYSPQRKPPPPPPLPQKT